VGDIGGSCSPSLSKGGGGGGATETNKEWKKQKGEDNANQKRGLGLNFGTKGGGLIGGMNEVLK